MKATWTHPILRKNWDALARWVGDGERLPEVFRGPRGDLSVEPLGCGHYGCVLRTAALDVVLKITSDASEAAFVATVLGMKNQPTGLVRYHAIAQLPGSYKRRSVYAIWREEAFDVGDTPSAALRLRQDYDGQEARLFLKRLAAFKVAAAEARTTLQASTRRDELLAEAEEDRRDARGWVVEAFSEERSLGADMFSSVAAVRKFLGQRRGARRVSGALEVCEFQAGMMSGEYGGEVGLCLSQLMTDGILLADVHFNNIGRALRDDYGPEGLPVITDPGHAYYLTGEPYDLSTMPVVTDATSSWPGVGRAVATRANPPSDSRSRLAAAMRAVGEPGEPVGHRRASNPTYDGAPRDAVERRMEQAIDSGLLTRDGDEYDWQDAENGVAGTVGLGDESGWAVIYGWSSFSPGRGNTVRSIGRLRALAPKGIMVLDPGEDGTESRSYWEHLFDKGLVDALCDEYNRVLRQRRANPWDTSREAMEVAEGQVV